MKKYKIFSLIITVFIAIFMITGCVNNIPHPTITTPQEVKNVILIIGDGMGENHIKNAKTYFDMPTFAFESNYLAMVDTSSKSIGSTDSAAAATAMATGYNVSNGKIGMDGKKTLTNIIEIAEQNNKKTGIITSDNLFGATPAAFSSHAKDRDNTNDIVKGQAKSGIDLMIGESSSVYDSYKTQFEENGYTMYNDLDQLTSSTTDQKIVANLTNIRSVYNPSLTNQIDISYLTQFALNYLDCEEGFVLMVECAHIDKYSHKNQIVDALCEVRALNDVANACYEFAEGRDDTAVIVTADHETGGLKATDNKSDISNKLYTKSSHTSRDVPLYTYNCTFENVKSKVKNTFIFEIMKYIVL